MQRDVRGGQHVADIAARAVRQCTGVVSAITVVACRSHATVRGREHAAHGHSATSSQLSVLSSLYQSQQYLACYACDTSNCMVPVGCCSGVAYPSGRHHATAAALPGQMLMSSQQSWRGVRIAPCWKELQPFSRLCAQVPSHWQLCSSRSSSSMFVLQALCCPPPLGPVTDW
jgi:hypothetical protein